MKEYKYSGYDYPIIVNDNGDITYRGREVERYFHGYNAVGAGSGFSITSLIKAHYIDEMNRIDSIIKQEEYRKENKEIFKQIHDAEEDIDFFLNLIEED